jgi:hypothetical protein
MTFSYRCDPSPHNQIHQDEKPSSSQIGHAPAVKGIHVDGNRENREPDDAKSIPQNGGRECRKNLNPFALGISQEKVPR